VKSQAADLPGRLRLVIFMPPIVTIMSPSQGRISYCSIRRKPKAGEMVGQFRGHFVHLFRPGSADHARRGPAFFFDDSRTPQGLRHGNGGMGRWWRLLGRIEHDASVRSHPTGARNLQTAKNDEDKIESAYRFLLADLMPFGKKRAHPPRARWHQRVHATLSDRGVLGMGHRLPRWSRRMS